MSELRTDPSILDSNNPVTGILARTYSLLKAVANAGGAWCDIRVLKNFTVQVDGDLGGGDIKIFASNLECPGLTDDGYQLGTDISAAGLTPFAGPYRFVRAELSGATAPNVTVLLHGVA